MRIAWNRSDIDYTDDDLAERVVNGISEIWTGVVRYRNGRATSRTSSVLPSATRSRRSPCWRSRASAARRTPR